MADGGTVDSNVKCTACTRWAWVNKLGMYQNTCLCGAPFGNQPPPDAGGGAAEGKGKGKGKGSRAEPTLVAQLTAMIAQRPSSAQAKAAHALLEATREETKKQEATVPATQQVTAAAAKVQRCQTAFDKAQAAKLKLTLELEKAGATLVGAAANLAQAERERVQLFRTLVPPDEPVVNPSTTIDLSALLSDQVVEDSAITINLGAEFSNEDGALDASVAEEIDKRKKAVLAALAHTPRASFSEAQGKLKEHREKLSEVRATISKKRRQGSPGPQQAQAPAAGDAAASAAGPAGGAAAAPTAATGAAGPGVAPGAGGGGGEGNDAVAGAVVPGAAT
ncbi:unnamed protein product, partial [Prorocentrum cordatum]